jgi:hypothetical protein
LGERKKKESKKEYGSEANRKKLKKREISEKKWRNELEKL